MSLRYVIALLLPYILTVSSANAQLTPDFDKLMLFKIADASVHGDPAKEPPKGSPRMNDEFLNATVKVKDLTFTNIPMRYNIYQDFMEFLNQKTIYIIDPQIGIQKIELDGRTFVIESYEQKSKIVLGFFIELDSGNLTVLMKRNVYFRDQQPAKPLETGPTPPTFTNAPNSYYFKIKNGPLVKIESIKKLIASVPDKQTELTEFAKKEKLSKDEAGLAKLAKYYNSFTQATP